MVEKSRTIDRSPKANEISSTFATSAPLRCPCLNFELGGAGFLAPLAALDAHLLECSHAAFVARAAGLDALAKPDLFLRQFLVEQCVLLFLGGQCRFLANQERIVVARPVEQPAAVEFENARGHGSQKRAVVRHEHERRRPAEQKVFQPADRVDIEMVRWLVEQQHIGLADERASQEHAPLHAGGKRFDVQVGRQVHSRQQLFDFLFRLPKVRLGQFAFREAAENHLVGPAHQIARNLLRQPSNLNAGREHTLAAVGRHIAAHHSHQRRLPRPVAAQEPDPLRRLDLARHFVQQRRAEESNRDFVEAD